MKRYPLFRLLLRLFPSDYRARFEGEMLVLFQQRLMDARRDGVRSLISFWTRTVVDSVRSAAAERLRSTLPAYPPVSVPRPGTPIMQILLNDFRHACLTLTRRPVFLLGAVATLALGIGANTAMFSVVRSVVLAPLPYSNPERLVSVAREADAVTQSFSYFHYQDWQAGRVFESLAGFTSEQGAVTRPDGNEYLRGTRVTADFFETLGRTPLQGRTFTAEEDIEGGPLPMIISERLWRRWGADPELVGTVIRYEDRPTTVVGIMPADFYFPDADRDFWMPLQGHSVLKSAGITTPTRGINFIGIVARLMPGSSLQQAQDQLRDIEARAEPDASDQTAVPVLTGLHEAVVGDVVPLLAILQSAAALVLLVACANVSNLLLARASTRRREFGIRRALGAGRMRLVGQMLAESAVLAALGGAAGLLLGWTLQQWLLGVGRGWIVRQDEIGVDWVVLLFSAVVAGASIFVIGISPALAGARQDLTVSLNAASRAPAAASGRLRRGFTVAQVAIAMVLLISAGLVTRSFVELTSRPTGFNPRGVLTTTVSLPSSYQADTALDFYATLRERLRASSLVESVSVSNALPFGGNDFRQRIDIEGSEGGPAAGHWAKTVIASPGYFRTLGIALRSGRDIELADRWEAPKVAVVNETFARALWPNRELVVGQRFHRTGGISGSIGTLEYFRGRPPITVIGVVADEQRSGFGEADMPIFYIPHAQMPWPSMTLAIATSGDPLDVLPDVRRQLTELDAGATITTAGPLTDRLRDSVLAERLRSYLIGSFALTAGLLALVGIYSLIAFGVSSRMHEIGVRMALGAGRIVVIRQVLAEGIRLTLIGSGVGLAVATASSHWLESILFGVSPSDPVTYLLAAIVLMAATLLACFVPARRASSVDPTSALRAE